MRQVTARGRWLWALSGLAAATALAIPGVRLITFASVSQSVQPQPTVVRTVTVPQRITSLDVQSYGMPVQVTAAPVRHVRVTETIGYDPRQGPPAVTQSVSGGRLTLADPACNNTDCGVAFAVTVPPDVAVTVASEGGPVTVSGTNGASLDSGGGQVSATGIHGPLTVTTEGGPVVLNGLTGLLSAETGGGTLWAQGVTAATATVITAGGDARIEFAKAPDTVIVSTDGGAATMAMPGGPYALTTDANGGPQTVGIPTSPTARRSITVTSGGGPLVIVAAANRLRASGLRASSDYAPPPPPPPPSAP
jgi:hypothetical protein